MTAFKQVIAFSGLSRLLQSRLGEWGEAAAAAKDCASFASACCSKRCSKRLWYCSKDSPNCVMTKKVQEHRDVLKNAYENQEQPPSSTRAGSWAGGCERCCSRCAPPPHQQAAAWGSQGRKMICFIRDGTSRDSVCVGNSTAYRYNMEKTAAVIAP